MAVTSFDWVSSTPLTNTGIQLAPSVDPNIARQQARMTTMALTNDAAVSTISKGELGLQSIIALVQDNANVALLTFTSEEVTVPTLSAGVYHFIASGPTAGTSENV